MIDKIISIFESSYRNIVAVRNEYARKVAETVDKYLCDNCKHCDICDDEMWRNCRKSLDEAVEKLENEKADREGDIFNIIEDEIRKLGLEAELGFDYDSNCYFNMPGYPREYRYYNVYEYHRVIDYSNRKVYIVEVWLKELNQPYITEYVLTDVDISEYELIDEELPFTNTLTENIPWGYIRPEWAGHINDFINTLAKAEREGRLEEALKEVIAIVKAGLWVYDYMHFYAALVETCKEFNIALEVDDP